MDHFRVRKFDQRNWVIEQLVINRVNNKTGKVSPDHWRILGYYGQLCDVANALLKLQIQVPDGTLETQLPALVAEIKAAEIRITKELRVMGEAA